MNRFTVLSSILVTGILVAAATDDAPATSKDRDHWSYQPLRDNALPDVELRGWSNHPIDRFVLARLEAGGIEPVGFADRRQLLRRASLGVIGLPPTPEQVDAFVANPSPDAWERVVHDLLSSPHYGEKWGRHWLDLARYADSGGYEFDVARPTAWPYRDFVVNALNQDLPFDEFVRLQIAGDEIDPQNPWARAATGFLTAGATISNQQSEQNRYDELDDILSTVGSAVLGLTVGCARCHDHKFDAIPTRDYYRMLAAFTSTRRRETPMVSAEEMAGFEKQRSVHEQKVAEARTAVDTWLAVRRQTLRQNRVAALPLSDEERTLLVAAEDPTRPHWQYTLRTPTRDWFEAGFDGREWASGPGGFGTRHTPGAHVGTLWKTNDIWLRREFEWDEGRPDDFTFVVHHDEDVEIYLNGTLAARARGYTSDYVELPPTDEGRQVLQPGKNLLAVHCHQTGGGRFIDVHPARRSALEGRSPRDVALTTPYTRLFALYREKLEVSDRELVDGLEPAEQEKLEELRRGLQALERSAPRRPQHVLCMTDASREPAKSYLLGRGNPAQKLEEIDFGYLSVLTPTNAGDDYFRPHSPEEAPSTHRRLALARWLTDPVDGAGHLTARVIVNRIWLQHFGAGLVRTPSDFGRQGDRPAHPELLDWLARQLIDGGWRLKDLHRLILSSSAYRLDTRSDPTRQQQDPDLRLWWRRRPLRLPAEAVRDSILSVSGCLNPELGGASVQPWMPAEAIATGSTNKWPLDVVDGPRTWRRSIYVFMRRSVRFPLLEVFDAPDATASCGQRNSTTTATQALALLNSGFVRDQSRRFAERLRADVGDARGDRVDRAFRLALSRNPETHERESALAFIEAQAASYEEGAAANGGTSSAEEQAMGDFCQVLFNLNEFLYQD